jgi:hypothetical protein
MAPDYACATPAGEARQVMDGGPSNHPLREWRMPERFTQLWLRQFEAMPGRRDDCWWRHWSNGPLF